MKKLCLAVLLVIATPLMAQRLPKTVIPSHYDLTFAPDFSSDTFRGEAAIELSVQQPTREVTLHALQLTFDEVSIRTGGKSFPGSVKLDAAEQTAVLSFPEQIPIGPARLEIRYSGILNRELRGLYLGQTGGRKYAATQMEATDARRAFPGFDEPDLKATFSISAVVDEGDAAISNGALLSDTGGPPGKRTVRFATTPRMSTYLVALVVGPFECIEGRAVNVPMRVCATPDKVHLGKLALSMSQSFTSYFNDYFGLAYPFGKLDHIGVPDFAAGAMENTGAIIYRDLFLLKDPETAAVPSQKSLAAVVSHEIAHMWFGDLVTMRWWDDLWLNEGFASWIGSKPIETLHPEWNVGMDDVQDITGSMTADSLQNTRPIKVEVTRPAEFEELFDPITYGKAAAVLEMIESYVGEETFRRGVSAYIREHSFGNATADDFATALSRAAKQREVDRILDTFVKQPGVPMITTEASCVNGRSIIKARQRRFFLDARRGRNETDELWHIPVCFRAIDSEKQTCKLVGERTYTFRVDGCSAPVFLNADGAGYYLIAPDQRELQRISSQLGKLTDTEKIALLRDEWLLVRATRRDLPDFLSLAESVLASSRQRAVVEQLLGSLKSIPNWIPEPQLAGYRNWLASQLRPLARELGWEPVKDEHADRAALRAGLINTLALTARDAEALTESRRRARQYLGDAASIHPELVSAILSGAAVEGDASLYELAEKRLDETSNPEERQHLLSMVAAFRDPRLMRRTLERALLPQTRITESGTFLSSVLASREGRDLAWQFLKARWDDVEKKVPGPLRRYAVRPAASFCDAGMRDEVKQFFTERRIESAERALAQTIEAIDLCIQTSRFQAPRLAEWLKMKDEG